jgi:hypothetical protein
VEGGGKGGEAAGAMASQVEQVVHVCAEHKKAWTNENRPPRHLPHGELLFYKSMKPAVRLALFSVATGYMEVSVF